MCVQRIQEVIYDAKSNGSGSGSGMLYNAGGVGGDASCSMQVLIDPTTFAGLTDTEHFRQTMPHNCVKVPLSQFSSVSAAVAVVKKAKESKWPIAVCSSDSAALRETDDSFIADFAVGVGAGQLMSGGVFAAESYAKFNRLLEIQGEDNKVPYAGSKFRVSMALH